MTDEELLALKELCKKAKPFHNGIAGSGMTEEEVVIVAAHNSEFFVAAHEAMSGLIDELISLRAIKSSIAERIATEGSGSQVSGDILIKSLQKWCKDNEVKIRLTHENYIAIQERIAWQPPEEPPKGKTWVKDLIFIDCATAIYEKK